MKGVSTQSYKGVRDFYPEDERIQNYIFSVWRNAVELYGYEEIAASPLESAELYTSKTSDEIVSEQTYTFKDRGDRSVTLRPEMTPTVARMVAARKRDLALPIRWFSIPNLFRYEKPQRGRLREHFQLNVDIFGSDSVEADIEMLSVAHSIMREFGATTEDFVIKINDRRIINSLYESFKIPKTKQQKLSQIIDKKEKIDASKFSETITDLIGKKAEEFIATLESNELLVQKIGEQNEHTQQLISFIEQLAAHGITNIEFTPTLMRGFDYYTGLIFEIFDTHEDNNRSLFGGGRYDNLLELFGEDPLPAVGFGMGDVTMRDFLETHGLLPNLPSTTDIYLCRADDTALPYLHRLARSLRRVGINVAIDVTGRKIAQQIKSASKKGVRHIACIGSKEAASGTVTLKNIETGEESAMKQTKIAQFLLDHRE